MATPLLPGHRAELISELNAETLDQLCQAAGETIEAGGGFGWVKPPPRHKMEAYWRGLLLVPGRHLFVVRLDGVVAGAMELHEEPSNMEARKPVGKVRHGFIALWARGRGLGDALLTRVEVEALNRGMQVLELDVRATQDAAIRLFERKGYTKWGAHPRYAHVGGDWVTGLHYYKILEPSGGAGT